MELLILAIHHLPALGWGWRWTIPFEPTHDILASPLRKMIHLTYPKIGRPSGMACVVQEVNHILRQFRMKRAFIRFSW
jgi:hypothetical protein